MSSGISGRAAREGKSVPESLELRRCHEGAAVRGWRGKKVERPTAQRRPHGTGRPDRTTKAAIAAFVVTAAV